MATPADTAARTSAATCAVRPAARRPCVPAILAAPVDHEGRDVVRLGQHVPRAEIAASASRKAAGLEGDMTELRRRRMHAHSQFASAANAAELKRTASATMAPC